MTVCIAAACRIGNDPKLVLCTDWQISGVLGSAEIKLKQRIMGGKWHCLTAGDDDEIRAFVLLLRNRIIKMMTEQPPIDETNIVGLIRGTLAARKKDKIDEIVRGQYAISYDDLLNIGKTKFPDDDYRQIMAKVRTTFIETECIIAGFIDDKFPILLETSREGKVAIREDFAVVGEGSALAQSVMLQRAYSDARDLDRAVYTVYEAKKYAEGVSSVGKYTTIQIVHADGSLQRLTDEGRNFLNEQYQKLGPQKIPNDLKMADGFFTELKPAY